MKSNAACAFLAIAFFSSPVFALPLNGSRDFSDSVAGYSSKSYTDSYLAELPVHIVLQGWCDRYSDVNLNLYVYDSRGKLVAKSENPECWQEVTFTPRKQERFELVVKSQHSVSAMKYDIKIEAEFGEPGEQ